MFKTFTQEDIIKIKKRKQKKLFQSVVKVRNENEPTKFTLDHLQGIFYIYVITVVLIIIIFVIEVIAVYVKALLY